MQKMSSTAKTQGQLYRTLWRWHFYAGLICLPLIFILALSGSVYLFKPQLEAWQEANLPPILRSATEVRKVPNAHIQAALSAVPNSSFAGYRIPSSDLSPVRVELIQKGEKISVFINPFTLNILKIRAESDQIMQIAKTLHGELFAGNVGSFFVELAASWAIILIISGLYLWWPQKGQGMGGVLYPRLSLKNRRFWKDLHAVTGFWVSIFALFLIISGLPWALVWGSAFKEIRSLAEDNMQQDWQVGSTMAMEMPMPSWQVKSATHFDLSLSLLAQAEALNFAPPAILTVLDEHKNTWQLSSNSQNRTVRATALLDSSDGRVLSNQAFAQKPLTDRIVGVGIAAHEGQLFGWVNQMLGVLTTIGLMVLSASGFILWRKRKPLTTLGAPPAMADAPNKKVIACVLCISILLPALCISLLVVLLVEFCVLRRFQNTRQWLGLSTN